MLTVAVLINGEPIHARSAVNIGPAGETGFTRYRLDDGETILHRPDDGALALAKRLLERIHEPTHKSKIEVTPPTAPV